MKRSDRFSIRDEVVRGSVNRRLATYLQDVQDAEGGGEVT
jgi:hypothetical protein